MPSHVDSEAIQGQNVKYLITTDHGPVTCSPQMSANEVDGWSVWAGTLLLQGIIYQQSF